MTQAVGEVNSLSSTGKQGDSDSVQSAEKVTNVIGKGEKALQYVVSFVCLSLSVCLKLQDEACFISSGPVLITILLFIP